MPGTVVFYFCFISADATKALLKTGVMDCPTPSLIYELRAPCAGTRAAPILSLLVPIFKFYKAFSIVLIKGVDLVLMVRLLAELSKTPIRINLDKNIIKTQQNVSY